MCKHQEELIEKGQEALDWIRFQLKQGIAPDTYFRKVGETANVLQELIDDYKDVLKLLGSASNHTEMERCLGCDNFMQCTNERCTRCLERIDGD